MRLAAVDLVHARLPLVTPFRTSLGVEHDKEVLLVRVETPDGEGWGECTAGTDPSYSSEYVEGAADVLRRFLVPRLLDLGGTLTAARVSTALEGIKGHPMAKAALELAVLDAETQAHGQSLSSRLGGVRDSVPAGVSVGIMDSVPQLLEAVGNYLDQGYVRIKLKIEPGWDLEPVRAVRERFGTIALQVDANTAYRLSDARHLSLLDDFHLVLLEQPLPADDLRGHAQLAARLRTPVCLDESVVSARSAADAIALGAGAIINIKAGRVGGYLEAAKVHEVASASGVPVWCGGMVETGIGRAANIALASLPGFVLPGDVSASSRFFAHDIVTEPVVLRGGHVDVPDGPGLGITVDRDALAMVTTRTESLLV